MVKKWLFLFLILETLSVTYLLRLPAFIAVTTLLYTFSGIAISILLVFLPEKRLEIELLSNPFKKGFSYQIIFLFLGGLFIYQSTESWINQSPISYKDADMIPVMQVMAQRFLNGNGSLVYSPIQEIWNGIQPVYLPAMWMPFVVSEKFSFDPRWITSFAVFLSFFLFIVCWRAHWKMRSGVILLFVSGILCVWLYTDTTHNFIRLSEEGIVVFYYSLLVFALLTDNFLIIGFVTALCTLSRYILVGWLPVIFLYLLIIRKQKKDTIYFLMSFSATIFFLVIVPFGYTPLQISFFQPEKYIEHAARIWKESPAYFSRSMGFAKFFGPEMIEVQHRILMIVSFLVPLTAILLIIYFTKQRAKKINHIGIATLKLTVVIVYAFIDVPYQYLFFTSSFISLIAITGVTSECVEKEIA
jgi:hypothetical protein